VLLFSGDRVGGRVEKDWEWNKERGVGEWEEGGLVYIAGGEEEGVSGGGGGGKGRSI